MDEKKDQLQTDLLFIQNELQAERQKGAEGDSAKIDQLEQRKADVQSQLEGMEKQEITKKQAEYNGGLKEVVYQVFDSVIPAESGNIAFGINDFQEMGEIFRQMIDVAIDENNETLNTYIAELLEAKDAKIRELNAQIIEKDVQLQESARNTDNYVRALSENERLEQRIVSLEIACADKDVAISNLSEQLKDKDEQISKLTEEINKPKASGIILPNQTKPSANLQQMMEAAKNKSVKTQVELALSGENFRGKVLITPPKLGGSENAAETFQDEVAEANSSNSGIYTPQVPGLDFRPEEESNEIGLAVVGDTVVRSDDAPATIGELKALEARIEERLFRIEQQKVAVA